MPFVDGRDAPTRYEMHTTVASPVDNRLRVEEGKIAALRVAFRVAFDAREPAP